MRTVKLIIAVWALAALVALIFGDATIAAEYGATTAGFLKVGVGARASGLGGAFTSIADDPSAVYWNPAGIGKLENRQLQFSHYDWYQDLKIENLYIVFPAGQVSFGAGVTYLDYGEFQSYDEFGYPGEELSIYSMAVSISMSMRVGENILMGATGKYIEQSFDVVKGSAFAGDIGVLADFNGVRLGLAAANIGSKMRYISRDEELPSVLRFGVSLRPFNDLALLSAEIHSPWKGNMSLHQGLELNFGDQLFARSGFSYQTDNLPGAKSLSYNLGAGIMYGVGQFDYTFIPSGNVRETIHNFSISFTW